MLNTRHKEKKKKVKVKKRAPEKESGYVLLTAGVVGVVLHSLKKGNIPGDLGGLKTQIQETALVLSQEDVLAG